MQMYAQHRSCSVEDKEDQFELVERIEVNGSVEGMAFAKVSHHHCYHYTSPI